MISFLKFMGFDSGNLYLVLRQVTNVDVCENTLFLADDQELHLLRKF